MNDVTRQFRDFFVSLKLTVVLLALGIVLIFWATLDQVNLGVWGVDRTGSLRCLLRTMGSVWRMRTKCSIYLPGTTCLGFCRAILISMKLLSGRAFLTLRVERCAVTGGTARGSERLKVLRLSLLRITS